MARYHGRDLRRGRYSEPNRIYLVTVVSHGRACLFTDLGAGRLLISAMREACTRSDSESLAFVVMPDHLHWLVRLGPVALSRLVQRVKVRSSIGINRLRGRRGPVWQKGYHDHAVRRDEDLVRLARYVVANPLRAGLVRRLGDYPHRDAVWL